MISFTNKPREVVILTEHFSPSTAATAQLVTDLADQLHQTGALLRVITSTPGSTNHPYPVLRISGSISRSDHILTKLTNGLLFFFGSAIWLSFHIKTHQSLFIVSNPPFIGLIGLLLSALKGTRYIFLFQDVFPRSASLTGILPAQGPITFFWRSLIKLVLTNSQETIVLSQSMIQRCHIEYGSGLCLTAIPNWAITVPHSKHKRDSLTASKWGLRNVFTIQYSGNFGRLHDILTILEAARLLQDEPIKFVFVGGGAKYDQIRAYINHFQLSNIIVKPYQPRELLDDSIASCDLSIVSLISGAEDTVAPSKVYGILASSRPIILISRDSTELSSLITNNNCGVVISQGDVIALCNSIKRFLTNDDLLDSMAENAKRLYDEQFGRDQSFGLYHKLLIKHRMIS